MPTQTTNCIEFNLRETRYTNSVEGNIHVSEPTDTIGKAYVLMALRAAKLAAKGYTFFEDGAELLGSLMTARAVTYSVRLAVSAVEHIETIPALPETAPEMAVATVADTPQSASPMPAAAPRVIEDGTYTADFGNGNWKTLRIKTQPADADFQPGKTIMQFLSGPDNTRNYTSFAFLDKQDLRVSVWSRFRSNYTASELEAAVRIVLGDPAAAGLAYALRSNRCYRCRRTLTVPASIHAGLGPECRRVVG